ncbi:methyltransferase domain-containing protein [Halobacterium salinarum]|uniref:class I SAM-dependent methyltransferase n=1 Tax=Halobacterium salinarum TaxID=2242 RepID=UPI002552E2AD|nr:methyltransferase domain-containing protein [Halobacterium salinarum]MDL0123978.1 methyltransferase domain-containing protein [Halobacterium salinarum]
MSMTTRAIRIIRDEGVTALPSKIRQKVLRSNLAFKLYDMGILSHDTIYGEEYYEKMDRESALQDAETFAKSVFSEYDPANVIEFGCGTGRLLYPYDNRGIGVQGLELSSAAKHVSKLDNNQFVVHDLAQPYEAKDPYDLALCVEVLEHLPADAADTVVASISASSSVAIVTAATPEQGGTHHVNEQPHEYWIEKFTSQGMAYQKEKTDRIRSNIDMIDLTWIPKNLLIFEDQNE